jgi:E3 ubiquitin-protein ligase DOA10
VDEFKPDVVVRETPCKHLFHDQCLMKWIETKLEAPDCPFCRAEIKVKN